jgi:hypothetical protein
MRDTRWSRQYQRERYRVASTSKYIGTPRRKASSIARDSVKRALNSKVNAPSSARNSSMASSTP